MKPTSLIVIGALNTDIIAFDLQSFPQPNDPVYGGQFKIGPGGKSGNIANMAGHLSPAQTVAMISRTVRDDQGLWKYPVDGLEKAGVNTDYIKVLSRDETPEAPSIALVGVDRQGNNMCFIAPGVSREFSKTDIDAATPLFEAVAANNGIFALSLECPSATAKHAINKAVSLGIRVALDPGGLLPGTDIANLLAEKPYIFKPNEFEVKMITNVEITDMNSAKTAASKLKELGAQNILITHGEHGAYLFSDEEAHLTIPSIKSGPVRDATGCGDQTMATLCVYLQRGKSLREAAETAVLAGTMQFYRSGIQPISKQELEARL